VLRHAAHELAQLEVGATLWHRCCGRCIYHILIAFANVVYAIIGKKMTEPSANWIRQAEAAVQRMTAGGGVAGLARREQLVGKSGREILKR
jgi:hypothetical protein